MNDTPTRTLREFRHRQYRAILERLPFVDVTPPEYRLGRAARRGDLCTEFGGVVGWPENAQ